MKVSQVLNDVEQECTNFTTGIKDGLCPNRLVLTTWMTTALQTLIGLEQWSWAVIRMSPVAAVDASQRAVDLPTNFGTNFIRYTDDNGSRWACKLLSASTSEQWLDYKSPAQFFSFNLADTGTGLPAYYTITTKANGYREILVHPLSSATYSITGMYIPTDWSVGEENDELPIPGNSTILHNALLARIFKSQPIVSMYRRLYQEDLDTLRIGEAKNTTAQVVPIKDNYGNRGRGYSLYTVR
jgi:hypothetical protein